MPSPSPLRRIQTLLLALAATIVPRLASAAPAAPPASPLHAWYHEGTLKSEGASVIAWANAATSGTSRDLTRTVGEPKAHRVQTPTGTKTVLRLESSALWQPVSEWGTLSGPRTILLLVRTTPANGVLLDGSTRSGSDPIRKSAGKWESAATPSNPSPSNGWEIHDFVFEGSPKPLGGLILGANVATKETLNCDIAEVLIFPKTLSADERDQAKTYLKEKWGSPTDLPPNQQPRTAELPQDPRIFRKTIRKHGDDGVNTYRIPGLASTPKGTLIAVFDARNKNGADLPGDIDVGMMRSTDNGTTWSPMQRIIDFDANEPESKGNGVGDPAVLVDHRTGTIFVAALWSHGPRAWFGSGPGLDPKQTGQLVLVKSTDDGLTWSAPINITRQVKDPAWNLCFNGPGSGIQLKDGTLVFPAQFKQSVPQPDGKKPSSLPHSCFIASQDGGETWKISPPAIPSNPLTSESAIVQLENGSLLLSMRNESRSGTRAWARWDWKDNLLTGKWSEPWLDVVDPTCMASLIAHPHGELLLSNPAHSQKRVALTVRSSADSGKSWSQGRVLDPGPSMYSSLTILRDGQVGVLYEAGDAGGLAFARFPLEWVLEGASLPTVAEPRPATGKFGWWPARHAAKVEESKRKDITVAFLGDSITQGWESQGKDAWNKHFASAGAANFGFGGDSTQHLLWRIQNGELQGSNPKAIVLLIGTNNARHSDASAEQITDGIRAILEHLKKSCPTAKVLLLGILPRGATPDDPYRQRCESVNQLLPTLADGKHVLFLNVSKSLLEPDQTLSKGIAPDLLHLSPKGYAILATAITEALKPFKILP
jgi:sialidase-1